MQCIAHSATHGQLAWLPIARCRANAVSGSKLQSQFLFDFTGGAIANKKWKMSSFAAVTQMKALAERQVNGDKDLERRGLYESGAPEMGPVHAATVGALVAACRAQ